MQNTTHNNSKIIPIKSKWHTPLITIIHCKQIGCCKGVRLDTEATSPQQT